MKHIENIENEPLLFQPEQASSCQMRLSPIFTKTAGIEQYSIPHDTNTRENAILKLSSALGVAKETMTTHNRFGHNLINWLINDELVDMARSFAIEPKRFEDEHQDVLKIAVAKFHYNDCPGEIESKQKIEQDWQQLVKTLKITIKD